MADMREKAWCIIWLAESKAILTVQQNCCHVCGRDFTVGETIQHWFKQKWTCGNAQITWMTMDARRGC